MNSFTRKIRYFIAGAVAATGMVMAIPAAANAAGEVVTADFSLQPQSGDFLTNGFKPANWSVENSVATADPLEPEILPSKVIDLTLPAGRINFNPGNMAVCPDSQVGPPPTNVSVPVPTIVNRCPNSVLGNGIAKFVLARNNLNPNAVLDGVIVAFNGGFKDGRPQIKVYAYSYDTGVAIFTEAALQTDGSLVFNVPQLTSDSSVSQFNFAIPSKNITLDNWGPGNVTVLVPKGKKSNYVKAKCSTGSFPWAADFTFGTRDTNNDPTSPETFSSDSGAQACVGVTGRAKLKYARARGPRALNRRGRKTFRVRVRNSGTSTAKKVRIRTNGKWVKFSKRRVSNIPAGRTRTYRVKVGLKGHRAKRGRKTVVKFKVNARQSKPKFAKKRVRVK